MVSLALLPDELLLQILTEAAYVRSIKRALRLRLVCKRFASLANTAIFNSGILNCEEISNNIQFAPEFWTEYFAYLTLTQAPRKSQNFKTLVRIAHHICRHRYASGDGTCVKTGAVIDDQLKECVLELCRLVTAPCPTRGVTVNWPAAVSADATETEVDELALDFRRHLLSAAAWMGEKSLVVKLIGEGCNWFDGPSMFLDPIRAASHRGHLDIVKLLMVDDSINEFYTRTCPVLIINYFNDHTELLDLTLGPSWERCEMAPEDTHYLRRLAMNETRNLETFKRVLEEPQLSRDDPWWLLRRTHMAAIQGQADIVNYLIEARRAEVNDDKSIDRSIFVSRNPVEFLQGYKLHDRTATLLSRAARCGHEETVKILLDAGAKPDHAIEFAAMCGSKTLMRLLWEHDEYGNDAVQGAFVAAVEREDIAVFNLLKELGAKLDDDVLVALRQKAQGEELESMVRLLDEDVSASAREVSRLVM